MRYREVIRMPLWLLSLIYLFFLSFVMSIWVSLGDLPALIAVCALSGLLLILAVKSALVIEVDEVELRVGNAHIELKYLDTTISLSTDDMKRIRTRDANPSAFLAIRFWNAHGVKVELNDIRDSTPYWLITSKKSQELAQLLNSLKA
ncbi:MAG: DUF3093 family protein [Actinobacteria bacterium]|nr:DUF3093 domain-containing protein [Actinomycetota bacterium]MSV39662.1 DUF3093 family protein [Actinomycetota bacterium]MSY48901.1 DUF3093 family protein [Actinomycetota bacterium]MTH92170.1 DUF3093 family protein [Actinomycetota bacterium]